MQTVKGTLAKEKWVWGCLGTIWKWEVIERRQQEVVIKWAFKWRSGYMYCAQHPWILRSRQYNELCDLTEKKSKFVSCQPISLDLGVPHVGRVSQVIKPWASGGSYPLGEKPVYRFPSSCQETGQTDGDKLSLRSSTQMSGVKSLFLVFVLSASGCCVHQRACFITEKPFWDTIHP